MRLRWLALVAVLVVAPATAGAALSYVGAGTLRNSTGNATTAFPAGYAAGDLCIVVSASYDSQTHTLTSPSGWTELSQTNHSTNLNHTSIFYRIVTSGSETAPTVNRTTSTARIVGRMQCYRGEETTLTPYIAGTVQQNTTTAGGTLGTATPAATTTEANSITMHVFTTSSVTNATQAVTSPTGVNGTTYSSGFNAGGTSTTRLGIGWYSLLQVSTGTTGTSNVTTTQADKVVSQTVIIRPLISASATVAALTATGAVGASAGTPSVTSGFPVDVNAGSTTTVTTASYTVAAGQMVIAVTMLTSNLYTINTPTNTPSSGTITWAAMGNKNATANPGIQMWKGTPGGSGFTGTTTATVGTSTTSLYFSVVAFDNASTTPGTINDTAGAGSSSTMQAIVNASAAGSLIFAFGMDYAGASAKTANANSTIVKELLDVGDGDSYDNVRYTALTSGAGNVTVGLTDLSSNWAFSAVEVKAGAGSSITGGGGGGLAANVGTGTLGTLSSSGGGGGGGGGTATITALTGAGAVVAMSSAGGGTTPTLTADTGAGAVAVLRGGGGATTSANLGTGTLAGLNAGGGAATSVNVGAGTLAGLNAGGGAVTNQITGTGALVSVSASGGGSAGSATITAIGSTGTQGGSYAGGGAAAAQQGGAGTVVASYAGGGGLLAQRTAAGAVVASYAGGGGTLTARTGAGFLGALSSSGGTGAASATLTAVAAAGAVVALATGGGGSLAAVVSTGAVAALRGGGGANLAARSGTGVASALVAGGGAQLASLVGTGTVAAISSWGFVPGSASATLTQRVAYGVVSAISAAVYYLVPPGMHLHIDTSPGMHLHMDGSPQTPDVHLNGQPAGPHLHIDSSPGPHIDLDTTPAPAPKIKLDLNGGT